MYTLQPKHVQLYQARGVTSELQTASTSVQEVESAI